MLTVPTIPLGLSILAEGENPGRSYWFIAVLVVLAIQHFAEKIKAKREAETNRTLGTDADGDAGEDWEIDEPQGYSDPTPANETLMDFFRSVNQPSTEPAVSVPPPRKPTAAAKAKAKVPPTPEAEQLSLEERRALAALKKMGHKSNLTHGRTRSQRMHSSAEHSILGDMLRSPENLRNAFILKEILEPPVASRHSQEPHQY